MDLHRVCKYIPDTEQILRTDDVDFCVLESLTDDDADNDLEL